GHGAPADREPLRQRVQRRARLSRVVHGPRQGERVPRGGEELMFDHVGLNVRDYAASRAFYEHALAPLGYTVVLAFDEWKACGFGTDQPTFWISEREPTTTGTHVAFTATDRATVDAFHEAALDAGGIDNGRPGI